MITQLPCNDPSIVAVRFNKKITEKDYDYLLPMLEDKLRRQGKLNLYCEFDGLEGMELNTIVRDGKFSLSHRHDFNKIALVGESKWMDWMMQLGDYFYSGDLKYFDKSKGEEALRWLKNKSIK